MPSRRYLLLISAAVAAGMLSGQSTTAVAVRPAQPATQLPVTIHHSRALTPTDTYYRIMCVVPLVGSGTRSDPVRPSYVGMHVPGAAYHTGIVAWSQQISDDGKHAVVEMVGINRAAFQSILSVASPDVVVFERGTSSKAQIETGIRKYRKDFTFDSFPRAVVR